MWQLFFGSLLLSLIHASIPNHWLPVVAIGKAEKWTQREILFVTAISGFAHTISTVIVGIMIGIIGIGLTKNYTLIIEKVAPVLLIVIGLIYIIVDRVNHREHIHKPDAGKSRNRSRLAIITSLALTMFLSPCMEIEAYYLQAAMLGWPGIILLSVIYVMITVTGMLLLVFLASRGIRSIQSHYLDHHEKLLSGVVLMILGILALFVQF